MATNTQSNRLTWAGRILSALPVLFMLGDGIGKLVQPPEVVDGTAALGYSLGSILGIGVVQLVCTLLYVVPRTAVLGAVLLTGYLGGAVATHVRVAHPWATHVLFPTYLGVMLWGGLFLRDPRVRALLPLRAPERA